MDINEAIDHLEYINWRYCTSKYDSAMRMAIGALRAKLDADHVRDAAKMMPRMIDANELLKKKFLTREFDGTARGWTLEVVSAKDIEDAPTIDPESLRPHGRWEEINGYLRCSECKDVYIYEDWIEDGKWKFCPNCGAQMDKEMLESEVSE